MVEPIKSGTRQSHSEPFSSHAQLEASLGGQAVNLNMQPEIEEEKKEDPDLSRSKFRQNQLIDKPISAAQDAANNRSVTKRAIDHRLTPRHNQELQKSINKYCNEEVGLDGVCEQSIESDSWHAESVNGQNADKDNSDDAGIEAVNIVAMRQINGDKVRMNSQIEQRLQPEREGGLVQRKRPENDIKSHSGAPSVLEARDLDNLGPNDEV